MFDRNDNVYVISLKEVVLAVMLKVAEVSDFVKLDTSPLSMFLLHRHCFIKYFIRILKITYCYFLPQTAICKHIALV